MVIPTACTQQKDSAGCSFAKIMFLDPVPEKKAITRGGEGFSVPEIGWM